MSYISTRINAYKCTTRRMNLLVISETETRFALRAIVLSAKENA